MDQNTIDSAVAMATRAALYGSPVARIIWVPPAYATDDPKGSFAVFMPGNIGAADKAPWD